MSARSAVRQAAAKAVILFGALFLVSVLLAAMPNHRAPGASGPAPQESVGKQPEDSRQGQQVLQKQAAGKHVPARHKIQ